MKRNDLRRTATAWWRRSGMGLAAAALILAAIGCRAAPEPALPDLGRAPDFTLTNQQEQTVSMDEVKGKVLLANFIYTHCPDICPLQTAHMVQLQRRLAEAGVPPERVHLLSFSVDPERDTPPVLLSYAQKHGANLSNWDFLTGPLDQMRQVVVEGFKIPAFEKEHTGHDHAGAGHGETDYLVAHSDRTVLVDPAGVIRAYYRLEEWNPDQVVADVQRLLK